MAEEESGLQRAARERAALSEAMYAVLERRPGLERMRLIVLLDDPADSAGAGSIAVFGYPRNENPVARVLQNMTHHMREFGDSFGVHVDVYIDGVRAPGGRASPNAS
jgi:hypothetical protein